MKENQGSEKNKGKKPFLKGLFEKLDKKLEEKAKERPSCCSPSNPTKGDKNSCCSQ